MRGDVCYDDCLYTHTVSKLQKTLDGDNLLEYNTLAVVTFHTFPNDYMIKD